MNSCAVNMRIKQSNFCPEKRLKLRKKMNSCAVNMGLNKATVS